MQTNVFDGKLAAPVEFDANREIARFTLISNEYVGKDPANQPRYDSIAIRFTAFKGKAKVIAEHLNTGDQLSVIHHIKNNNYKNSDNVDVYGYNFIVDDFTFGAKGKVSKEIADKVNRELNK